MNHICTQHDYKHGLEYIEEFDNFLINLFLLIIFSSLQ